MKFVPPEKREATPPTKEKLDVLAERARRRLPLFKGDDKPTTFDESHHLLQLKDIYGAIGYYISLAKIMEFDDDAEITFSQIARIIRADPDKPQRHAHQLPLPCSDKKTRTSKYVWKWHEVKHQVRKLMAIMVIKEIAKRL